MDAGAFRYFVVIDFEATCDKDRPPYPQEILEFPSVIIDATTGKEVAAFQTYVRPTYHPVLSDFCKQLTGINQSDVDGGVGLCQALQTHDRWLEECGVKGANFAIVTWGDWDCRVMLEGECRFKGITKPAYFDRWINLQVGYSAMTGTSGRFLNLRKAVEDVGLKWEGREHCGLDDARNTGRLLEILMLSGLPFSITGSLLPEGFQAIR